ncbi:1197_t:CDS:10 [Dentiscutata erythropus]|uniref:Protection of telomeres protein 1 n=1 Tax=Dentiscutata erythropus TaxID=1348616 RepID=A0A9N9ALM8_9GLOM|nr:1197_t:CDS:10 [Dentiscutata erythropus]
MTLELKRVKVEGHSFLSDLVLGERVAVTGVVLSYSPPRKTKGPDWSCSLQITDPSLNGKVTVIIFRAQYTELPEANIGNIFFGTGLRVAYYMDSPQLIAYKFESTCSVINDDLMNDDLKMDELSHIIMTYAKYLRKWWNDIENFYAGVPKSRKLTTIAEIHSPNIFFDTIAEVVEIHRIYRTTELFITDYTHNELLSNNDYVWNLPNGLDARNIFQITLWDEHVVNSENFEAGMYVYLQNIRTKYNSFNHFQGVIHGDPETRRTRVMKADRNSFDVGELIKRKERFMQKISPKITRVIDCDVKPTEVHNKFLIRGRIIDYEPDGFENFIRPYCIECDKVWVPQNSAAKEIKQCPECLRETTFIYEFLLMIEDEDGSVLPTLVSGRDAVRFLNGILPTKVMQEETSRQAFLNLIRKLLASVIDHGESTKFFEFCVESYFASDRERLYKLINTILEI